METTKMKRNKLNKFEDTHSTHKNYNNYNKDNRGKNTKFIKCHHCGRKGHTKNDCFYYKRTMSRQSTERTRTVQAIETNQPATSANYSGFAFMTGEYNEKQRGDNITFLLDSGASEHIINREDLFFNFTNLETPLKISVAKNGEFVLATKKGTLQVTSHTGVQGVLEDVLFCHEVPYNLLSVSRMQRAGLTIIFDQSGAQILKDGKVIMRGAHNHPEPENFRVVLAGSFEEFHTFQTAKRRKVQLEVPDIGPKFYDIQGNFVTPPLVPARLPEAFESLPVFGDPGSNLEPNKTKMLWDFVGADMNEEEFDKLGMYCSTESLRTGLELSMPSKDPRPGLPTQAKPLPATAEAAAVQLRTVRRHRVLAARDTNNALAKRHKYRGVRFIKEPTVAEEDVDSDPPLVPGKDILFRVRIYRPFRYSPREKKISSGGRHPLFVCDVMIPGRFRLSRLRERLACVNDESLRVDVSQRPDQDALATCKELFPSGFLFINNVFYNDMGPGCSDYSAPIREWAQRRGVGRFEAKDMAAVTLDQLTIKLGYPEVYVHQGNCEHLFTFAEVRLLGLGEPTRASLYPAHRSAASYNCVYCTTCAEYPASWVLTDCPRVPFDPALSCDTCFRLYMYEDGNKCGEFKAMHFKGNQRDITLTA